MKTFEDKEPVGVCMIILDHTGKKVLLGERKNAYKSGTFGMPGGRVETKEKIISALTRELEEEVGIIAKKVSYVGFVREYQDEYNFIHFGFLVESFVGEIQNKEPQKCVGWNWYDLSSLPTNMLTGHKEMLTIFLSEGKLQYLDLNNF